MPLQISTLQFVRANLTFLLGTLEKKKKKEVAFPSTLFFLHLLAVWRYWHYHQQIARSPRLICHIIPDSTKLPTTTTVLKVGRYFEFKNPLNLNRIMPCQQIMILQSFRAQQSKFTSIYKNVYQKQSSHFGEVFLKQSHFIKYLCIITMFFK